MRSDQYGQGRFYGVTSMVMLSALVGGMIAGNDPTAKPLPDPDPARCDPVVWRDSMDPDGWQLLLEQGYAPAPDDYSAQALYPPGCEAAQ